MQAITDGERYELLKSWRKWHRLIDIVSTPQSRAGRAYPLMVLACGRQQQTGSGFFSHDGTGGMTADEVLKFIRDFHAHRCVKCFPTELKGPGR